MLKVLGSVVVVLLFGAAQAGAQPMTLVASGADAGWVWQEGRVWTGPRAVGQAGAMDRIGFEAATGDVIVVITGHPTRSGEEGRYTWPGDCLMRLARPDLAGATLAVRTPREGASVLIFQTSRGPVAGWLRVSAGCDTTGGH